MRRVRRHSLQTAHEALRYRKWKAFGRIIKTQIQNECTSYKKIRKDMPVFSPDFEKLYFSDKRIAVYMAVFGGYDSLKEPLFSPDNVDYFIFTDEKVKADSKWKKIPYEVYVNDPNMTGTEKNRYLKMFPHLLFQNYEYSVYIDGNVQVMADFTPLAMQTDNFPVAMHLHKDRDCVYEEIRACLNKNKDTKQALLKHCAVLQDIGVPEHWGLLEAPVIARRHHDPVSIKMMETWWKCFWSGSRRDQIALIQSLWLLKTPPQMLGGLGDNVLASSRFIWEAHQNVR